MERRYDDISVCSGKYYRIAIDSSNLLYKIFLYSNFIIKLEEKNMEEISEEEINYFKNLEKRYKEKYNSMTQSERDDFDLWVLENSNEWLKIGGFTHKSRLDKSLFIEFVEMFSLVEMKPDDDVTDPSYVYFVTKRAMDYVKYMKAKNKNVRKKKK
jgi:hypothetical protein